MAYPNRTPEEQAAIDQRKYRAWNDLKGAVGRAASPAVKALAGAAASPQVNLATAVLPNLPQIDWRPPGAAYTPERTQQIVQDFRGSLPGPEAGKPTFADRRPVAPPTDQQPNAAMQALFQQSPVVGPRTLTNQGLVPQRPAANQPNATTPAQALAGPAAGAPEQQKRPGAPNAPAPGVPPAGTDPARASARVDPANVLAGQGYARGETGPQAGNTYEVANGAVTKYDRSGKPQGLGGAVNMLGPEESRNMFGGSGGQAPPATRALAGGGADPGYDPDQLAARQFERIKGAADSMMQEASQMFDSNPLKSAKIQAAQSLYAQLGGANNAGVAAGGGIAQEGIRGGSAQDVQRLLNEGQLNEQESKNQGALGLQRLTGTQAIDLEQLKNEGALSKERLITDREYARLNAERQDKAAEMMGLTTYDPTTGFPAGEVPSRKYQYGQQPQKQEASGPQAGMIYPGKDGKKYRYNGGDPNDSKSYTVMP